MSESEVVPPATPQFAPLLTQAWVDSLGHIAHYYGISYSAQSALNALVWHAEEDPDDQLIRLARHLGLRVKTYQPAGLRLSSWQLPAICEFPDGQLVVVTAIDAGRQASVVLPGEAHPMIRPIDALVAQSLRVVVARPLRTLVDERVDAYIAPYKEGWLRRLALPDLRPYGYVMLASFTANLLGLTGILFSKQVYDRVVPAESFNTLYVLFIGVMLAVAFDFMMRRTRTKIVDSLGKRADIRLSDRVFGHALRVKGAARPKSTGSFVAQLRDLDSLREMLTSSTVSVVADLPFFFIFLLFFWHMGGILVLVPLVALVAMVLPGLFLQKRLNRYVNEGMREASMRNAMLIEAVQGFEDIKSLQAEDRFQQRWNHFNAVAAEAQLKQRNITSGLQSWSQGVQTSVFACVIFFGAPMVIAGDMSTGSLVACSILGSRMMGPMAQFSQIFSRLQQARMSYKSVDSIMALPVDHPDRETRIGVSMINGNYEFKSARYFHDAEQKLPSLALDALKIKAGEKIALVGRIGAGKTTLLQALAGLSEVAEGEALLDGLTLSQIDPSDLRRDVGLLTQDSRLFHGTIRDNLCLGAPQADDAQILAALKLSGAADFVSRIPKGLDYLLLEDGRGLSGGQRQALMLSRLLLREPRVVLLDEPTAAMDETTESQLIENLQQWFDDRTVVLATHRMKVLSLVDRVLVIDRGKIIEDLDRDSFLRRSRGVTRQGNGAIRTGTRGPVVVGTSKMQPPPAASEAANRIPKGAEHA